MSSFPDLDTRRDYHDPEGSDWTPQPPGGPFVDATGKKWTWNEDKGRWEPYLDLAFATLSDKTTADLPAINTPLSDALDLKADVADFIAGAGALTGPAADLTIGTAAATNYTQSATAPVSPANGDKWLNITTGIEYVRYDDQWITDTPSNTWDGDIADINLDGGTDIGFALEDADLILVDDGANGTNRKSTLTRLWTWITTKLGALTSLTAGGAWAFESTTRPTSAGTGTPAATSLITRDDGDARFLNSLRSVNHPLNSGWTSALTTGASITAINHGLRVLSANGTTAGNAVAYITGLRGGVGVAPEGLWTGIDFTNPIAVNFAFRTRAFDFVSGCNWAFLFGNTEATAAGIDNMVKTGGNAVRGWVGLRCTGGNVTLIAVNGTSTVAESATIDTCINGHNMKGYRIVVAAGVASCYDSSGVLLGSLSNSIPTTKKEWGGPIIMLDGISTASQFGMFVQHVSTDW